MREKQEVWKKHALFRLYFVTLQSELDTIHIGISQL